MYFDLPLEQLIICKPDCQEPADFDEFWQVTISQA